jgi:hypothetical protein
MDYANRLPAIERRLAKKRRANIIREFCAGLGFLGCIALAGWMVTAQGHAAIDALARIILAGAR